MLPILKLTRVEFPKKSSTMNRSETFPLKISPRRASKKKIIGIYKQRKQVSDWVYLKCLKQKRNNEKITQGQIIDWAYKAKKKFFTPKKSPFYNSTASQSWITHFKLKYGITGDDQLDLQLVGYENINQLKNTGI